MSDYQIIPENCTHYLANYTGEPIDLTFLDPPFNQDKDYSLHDDNLPDAEYWAWMRQICQYIYKNTSPGGAIYFMQREKNSESVLSCLRETGWLFQNLIIWKKKSSAVPSNYRYGKQYQIIVYATKGKPRLFNRLRIDPPLPPNYKYERNNGMYVTDIWDDIRELTSGYFAGDEAIRAEDGTRFHKQQAPLALLLRIILSSSQVGDVVLDPFAGTGTTLAVAHQLARKSIGIEIDPNNIACIQDRLTSLRTPDSLSKYYQDYIHTEDLATIWGKSLAEQTSSVLDLPLFRTSDPD